MSPPGTKPFRTLPTLDPVCFIVMPFRRKPVAGAREGAPQEVDYDRLFDLAFRPALVELGYLPVRADVETGSVIIKDMLNRLQHSPLVVADVSLANANVYYEVGIRHAAWPDHCVLLAADWSIQLFDVAQLRTLRYPLSDGAVPEDQARRIRDLLIESLPALAAGRSPFDELVTAHVDEAFADEASRISDFQAELATVRLLRDETERTERLRALVEAQTDAALGLPDVAVELLYLVRDVLGWQAVLDLEADLPKHVRALPVVKEQALLSRSYLGDHEAAVAGLEALIRLAGPSPERCGLLGGRFKRLWREERAERLARGGTEPTSRETQYLNRAIEAYEQGMELDLNQYYCSNNLPGLLRARGASGDEARAKAIDTLVVAACRRAEMLGTGDEWLYDTLLGAAMRSADLAAVRELSAKLDERSRWRLHSTLDDAGDWIAVAPPEQRAGLLEILDEMAESFSNPEADDADDG